MFYQKIRRFSMFSLAFLLILTVASLVFVYLVSPLRDPTFQPNSANGGTLVPWLRGVRESDWLLGFSILGFLLASNITIILWLNKLSNPNNRLFYFLVMIMSEVLLFGFFYYAFLIYLLTQWLID